MPTCIVSGGGEPTRADTIQAGQLEPRTLREGEPLQPLIMQVNMNAPVSVSLCGAAQGLTPRLFVSSTFTLLFCV
jgi:hypothetical protein